MDNTTNCWARNKGSNNEWTLMPDPRFNVPGLEYYVGHEPPPPDKRTITLTVNGREWVLPEPIQGDKPSIVLRIVKKEEHDEEMAQELAIKVRQAIAGDGDEIAVVIGSYTAGR